MGVFYCFDNSISDAQNAPWYEAGVCCSCGTVCAICFYNNVRVSGSAADSGNMGGIFVVDCSGTIDLSLLWGETQQNWEGVIFR